MAMRMKLTAISLLTAATFLHPGSKSRNGVLLNRDMPGVFITFDKSGAREPRSVGETGSGIWLRVHNNYRFPIQIPATGSDSLGEVGVLYDLEEPSVNSEPRFNRSHHDVFSMSQLSPGENALFSLPSEELQASGALRVRFEIDDEDKATKGGPAPTHYAIFYGSLLPGK
jgi:hypothetical protein